MSVAAKSAIPHARKWKVTAAGKTHPGRVRDQNEDNILLDERRNLFIVADGMGGHGSGETASREAIDALNAYFSTHDLRELLLSPPPPPIPCSDLCRTIVSSAQAPSRRGGDVSRIVSLGVSYANARIHALNREMAVGPRPMGTTVAGIWFFSSLNRVAVFHVGDSRIYRLRSGNLVRLTMDHSLYEAWKREGMRGAPPGTNILDRAVGPKHAVTPDVTLHPPLPGDLFLACSDGLTDMVPEASIAEILSRVSEANLRATCDRLVDAANAKGGADNISVILALLLPPGDN